MPNLFVRFAISGINRLTVSRSKKFNIDRVTFDPTRLKDLEKYGLDRLGDYLKIISSGLHQIPAENIKVFAEHIITATHDTALYVDNTGSKHFYEQGHTYLYRSQKITVGDDAVSFIKEHENRSLRYFIRAFPNYILELPKGTVANMRQRIKSGEKETRVFADLRNSAEISSFQKLQWESDSSLVGDVVLGRNSIVLYTRQERYVLQNNQYIVDMINPATREFHPLDGSVIWLRILDIFNNEIIFAAVGSGKHRYSLMDATNNMGAMTIWHYMAQVQRFLYQTIPSDHESTRSKIEDAYKSDPVITDLYDLQKNADVDNASAFLRGLRSQNANETADKYTQVSDSG